MNRPTEALRSARTDEGFSIVEVVVAMVVLAVLSTGIAAGTSVVARMTTDNRARQIAVNLAEAKLDEDRGILDPTKIYAGTSTRTVSGHTFTTTQTTSLVSDDGANITCGSGKTIYYRQITVQVTWAGMLPTTSPVRSDTIMSPNGRINDAATGSISVLVTGSTGTPESGVSVTVTPVSSTATSLDTQPVATGPDGCTYAMGVAPGTYKVTLNRTGSVDTLQASSPFNDAVVVMPGATASVTFSYDQAMNYDLAYSTGSPVLPQKLPVTFLTASGAPYITSSSAAAPSTVALYPFPAGYTAIAGAEADKNGNTVCAAEDPAAWPGKTIGKGPGATVLAQGVRGAAPAAPGGSGTFTVPMGRFSLTNLNGLYVFAVAQNAATPTTGQPDCAAANGNALIFALGQITSAATTTFALPYGQYQIFTSTSASGTAPLPVGPAQNLSVSVPGQNTASTAGPGNALLLDPRVKS
jgi:prepilin-type N-terminal cleavage/methylation domain-containing protein